MRKIYQSIQIAFSFWLWVVKSNGVAFWDSPVYFIFDVQIDAVAELHSLIEMKELLPSCLSLSGFAFNLTSCFDFSFLVLFLQVHASQTTVKFNSVFPCRNFWGSERNKKTWGGRDLCQILYRMCVSNTRTRKKEMPSRSPGVIASSAASLALKVILASLSSLHNYSLDTYLT